MDGVRIPRCREDAFSGSTLDDTTVVHDDDIVGDLPHHYQVVGDEQHGHAELLL